MPKKIYKTLAITILLCAITFASNATELNELQEKKTNIQTQIDESKKELTDVTDELTENLKQIQKLDESIESSEETLNEVNQKISELEKEIETIELENLKVTQKYEIQKQLLDMRLVAIYEAGNTTYLDVVLGSKSVSDFISTYFLLSELASYDVDLLDQIDKEKKKIEEKNAQIETSKAQLEAQRRNAQKTQITLSNTKLLRENYMLRLSEEEQLIQAKIDEYNTQINQVETEIRSLAKIINFGEDYNGGPMQWPIAGHYTITSNYGMRVHPITGVYKLHTGVDISAGIGTNFTAIANGVVVKAEFNTAYGNMVIIDHGGGVQTLYAHGSEIVATLGQEIQAGDVVLKVGSTGYSTGPHAHFEIRINGSPMNPLDYVSIPEQND